MCFSRFSYQNHKTRSQAQVLSPLKAWLINWTIVCIALRIILRTILRSILRTIMAINENAMTINENVMKFNENAMKINKRAMKTNEHALNTPVHPPSTSKKLGKLIGQNYVNELDMPGKRVQLITEQDLGIQTMKKLA